MTHQIKAMKMRKARFFCFCFFWQMQEKVLMTMLYWGSSKIGAKQWGVWEREKSWVSRGILVTCWYLESQVASLVWMEHKQNQLILSDFPFFTSRTRLRKNKDTDGHTRTIQRKQHRHWNMGRNRVAAIFFSRVKLFLCPTWIWPIILKTYYWMLNKNKKYC